MSTNPTSLSRPAITKLLIGAVLMLGLLGLFIALAGNASAGGGAKVTVNSTANIDDGDCEGPPNDTGTGNCTLQEAIDMVNAGDADIINFHPPVFSKEQPGVINLCDNGAVNELPAISRNVLIDSKDSGVVLDGGAKDDDCAGGDAAIYGILAQSFSDGFDFELNGGKNFTVRNIEGNGIEICGGGCDDDESLGTIVVTGVIIENVLSAGVTISASNLESLSITNSDISSNEGAGILVDVDACVDACELNDSVVDVSGNRVAGGVDVEPAGAGVGTVASPITQSGVEIYYAGVLNSKITASVSENEVINGSAYGVRFQFSGCGSNSGVNVHVDENAEINGGDNDGVGIDISADGCFKGGAGAIAGVSVDPGDTSDAFTAVVTVNGNGDIENISNDQDGVQVRVDVCCEESDSSASVEVSDNGRITGEDDAVDIDTTVCCGDGNVNDVSVNNNDELTGEDRAGIDVDAFAGSSADASPAGVAGATGNDADDNTCTITIDGNNEIDGVGDDGIQADCFAGTLGRSGLFGGTIAGGPTSSGDNNFSSVNVTNNNDIDGDSDGVEIRSGAGSIDGEADDNLATATISGNGELTGDGSDGIEVDVGAGSSVEEGDDNATEILIEENQEIGGNDEDGIDADSFAGGMTEGSEGNSTTLTIVQNGDIEGQGGSGDGIEIDSSVCCDPANTNTININNNKGEITGHDDDGIDIETCCSTNIITIMDNLGNIRGGDDDGLEIDICGTGTQGIPSGSVAGGGPFGTKDCLQDSITQLTVINNSFSDSEDDGIDIGPSGAFEDETLGIKSVISNNIIEGNGDDGIDIESSWGLNIGPGNEIFENGTDAGDNGVEIDWCFGASSWEDSGNKFTANRNTITQNSIYDNFGLGIDLVGFDPDGDNCDLDGGVDFESVVGCVAFQETAINPNDCLPFPDLQTQSGDKLIGVACSLCTVEVFWADDDPANNDDEFGVPHGEGAEYIISGEADVDGNFSIQLPCDLGPGDLTATATDKLKNTSEFAANLVTLGTGSCATDTPVPTDTPDATATPVPPTATPVPAKVCGDVNLDQAVNSVDATLILQLKADMISSLANESSADVNNDGAITSVDAALVLQATAGLISTDALTCS